MSMYVHVCPSRHQRGELIGEAYFGVRAVVREIWHLFVLLGKVLWQKGLRAVHIKINILVLWP